MQTFTFANEIWIVIQSRWYNLDVEVDDAKVEHKIEDTPPEGVWFPSKPPV